MNKRFLIVAVILGALSVALGAFAAHGLKKILDTYSISIFETGVRYQFYHVFALLATGILFQNFNNKYIVRAGNFFIAGIACFSGSLYLLSFKQLLNIECLKWIAFITPIGGVLFILGWIFLLVGIVKQDEINQLKNY